MLVEPLGLELGIHIEVEVDTEAEAVVGIGVGRQAVEGQHRVVDRGLVVVAGTPGDHLLVNCS